MQSRRGGSCLSGGEREVEREPGATPGLPGSANSSDRSAPAILVELMNPANEALLPGAEREVLITSEIISHMIAHIALRRELRVVFDELFSARGAEISFREARYYEFGTVRTGGAADGGGRASEEGDSTGGPTALVTFRRAAFVVASHGETLLGYRSDPDGVCLNPLPDGDVILEPDTRLVVLTGSGTLSPPM
jgi:hypothetical protein